MSFILDALKKSELDRQRQAIPGLVESGIARPRPRLPTWAIGLGILLGINLVVLLFVLMRSSMTASQIPPAPAHTVKPPAADSAAGDAADKHFSPLDTRPIYAPEIPVTAAANSAAAPAPVSQQPMNGGGSGAHAIRRRDPVLTNEAYKANYEETLPSINEMNLTGEQALPALHLDVHVFATKASERFVFINMRKYHEGSTLQEGPSIERIRRDGVVLDYKGLRFLLPRQ